MLLTDQPPKNYRVTAKVNCFTIGFNVSAACQSEAKHKGYIKSCAAVSEDIQASVIINHVEECEPCLNLS